MSYCTKCGKPMEAGARFCTNCGAGVVSTAVAVPLTAQPVVASTESSATEVPVPVPSTASPVPVPDFVPPEPNRRPTVLIVVGFVILLIVAALGATFYFRGKSASPQAAGVAAIPADGDTYVRSLKLESYPGATSVELMSGSGENTIASFHTRDTADQVIGFYKVRFPVADTTSSEGVAELRAALPNGEHIVIHADRQANGTEVRIIREP